MLDQPKASAHTTSPPAPTATDSPGRFCSARAVRTTCRACLTAADHCGEGSDSAADGARSASACSGVAIELTNIGSSAITADSTRPMATTALARRFLHRGVFFDIVVCRELCDTE